VSTLQQLHIAPVKLPWKPLPSALYASISFFMQSSQVSLACFRQFCNACVSSCRSFAAMSELMYRFSSQIMIVESFPDPPKCHAPAWQLPVPHFPQRIVLNPAYAFWGHLRKARKPLAFSVFKEDVLDFLQHGQQGFRVNASLRRRMSQRKDRLLERIDKHEGPTKTPMIVPVKTIYQLSDKTQAVACGGLAAIQEVVRASRLRDHISNKLEVFKTTSGKRVT
jgi:hypothetical protein